MISTFQINLSCFFLFLLPQPYRCTEFVRHQFGESDIMKMYEFELLSQEEQIMILYQQGIYIGKRRAAEFTTLLYQLASFYIEITYASYRKAIQKITYSECTSVLDPYLEQIPLEYLAT